MKGFTEEMMWAITLILAVVILSIFFISQQGIRGSQVTKTVEERVLNEEGISTIFSLFNNKLPFVEKTYLETAIDSILQGISMKTDQDKAYYGVGVGMLNVTEIIPPLLESYTKGRWRLEVITPDGNYVYGNLDLNKAVYTYSSVIPVPEERTGEIRLYIG